MISCSYAIKCDLIIGMMPHHLCLILLVRSKLQVPPTLKGEKITLRHKH